MLIATSTVVHRVFTYDKSLRYTVVTGVSLFVSMVAFVAWHCITDETLMHPVLFGKLRLLSISVPFSRVIHNPKIRQQAADES